MNTNTRLTKEIRLLEEENVNLRDKLEKATVLSENRRIMLATLQANMDALRPLFEKLKELQELL